MSAVERQPSAAGLLTVAQVADLCQVSRRTIERAIADGRLRAAPLGRHGAARIRPEWLEEWIDGSARRVAGSKRQRHPLDLGGRPERGRLALAKGTGG